MATEGLSILKFWKKVLLSFFLSDQMKIVCMSRSNGFVPIEKRSRIAKFT